MVDYSKWKDIEVRIVKCDDPQSTVDQEFFVGNK